MGGECVPTDPTHCLWAQTFHVNVRGRAISSSCPLSLTLCCCVVIIIEAKKNLESNFLYKFVIIASVE